MRSSLLATALVPLWSVLEWRRRGGGGGLGEEAASWTPEEVAERLREAQRATLARTGHPRLWYGGWDPAELEPRRDEGQITTLRAQGRIWDGAPDLVFVHIPKTAGVAIKRASAPLYPYGMSKSVNVALQNRLKGQGAHAANCWFEQAPPNTAAELFGEKAARFYVNRSVFCSVRNPYDRIVSAYCYLAGLVRPRGHRSAASLNAFVHRELGEFQRGDYLRMSCFFVPQADYMQDPGGCKHVLDFDNLEYDYNNLMAAFGYNLTLSVAERENTASSCNLSRRDLYPGTRQLIERVYRGDFEKFGVRFGWV